MAERWQLRQDRVLQLQTFANSADQKQSAAATSGLIDITHTEPQMPKESILDPQAYAYMPRVCHRHMHIVVRPLGTGEIVTLTWL